MWNSPFTLFQIASIDRCGLVASESGFLMSRAALQELLVEFDRFRIIAAIPRMLCAFKLHSTRTCRKNRKRNWQETKEEKCSPSSLPEMWNGFRSVPRWNRPKSVPHLHYVFSYTSMEFQDAHLFTANRVICRPPPLP